MKPPTRVLHLCETGGIGGAETVVLKLIEHLDPRQVLSTAVLMRDGWLARRLAELGHAPVVMTSSRGYDLGFVWRLSALVLKLGAQIIHAHLPDANVYAAVTGSLARIPVLATYHGLIADRGGFSARDRLKLNIVRYFATRAVAVSSALNDQLVHLAGFRAEATRTIHNGVDWSAFDAPADAHSLRSELGLADGERVVGIVANLRPTKGYNFFIDAAARVSEKLPGTRFLIVGEEEAKLKAAMVEQIARLGLEDRVMFLGARDDIPRLLRVLDVFALSSLTEGMSIATVEAMGAGVPVVVTKSGGPEDIVLHNETGLLVPPADAEALAGGIVELLSDRNRAQRLARAGKAEVRERFSLGRMVSQYASLYTECVA